MRLSSVRGRGAESVLQVFALAREMIGVEELLSSASRPYFCAASALRGGKKRARCFAPVPSLRSVTLLSSTLRLAWRETPPPQTIRRRVGGAWSWCRGLGDGSANPEADGKTQQGKQALWLDGP